MDQIPCYGDERKLAYCAFCGQRRPETRDHCPSKVLLDEPYPENLPVVGACSKCNGSFSADEEYLACLLSCVLAGSTDPAKIHRQKTSRILTDTPALRARIESARVESDGTIVFTPELQRVTAVITKLARGHALHELHETCLEDPEIIDVRPLCKMSKSEIEAFETPASEGVSCWPEVGSRALLHFVTGSGGPAYPWLIVQKGRYRYHASVDSGIEIRIVIQEYLACLVRWD